MKYKHIYYRLLYFRNPKIILPCQYIQFVIIKNIFKIINSLFINVTFTLQYTLDISMILQHSNQKDKYKLHKHLVFSISCII